MKRRSVCLSTLMALGLTLALAQDSEAPAEVLEYLDFFENYDMIQNLDLVENEDTPPLETLEGELQEGVQVSSETVQASTATVRQKGVRGSTPTGRGTP